MSKPYVRPAHPADPSILADQLRAEDKAEVRAFSGSSPLEALTNGFVNSQPPYTICDGTDAAVGMFGVVPVEKDEMGAVWMLASPKLLDIQLSFLRQCRGWVERLNRQYPVLFNYVDARNEVHIRWLRWMGFVFINQHPRFGHEGRMFYEFVRIADV